MSGISGSISVVPPTSASRDGTYILSIMDCTMVSSLCAFVQVNALVDFLLKAPMWNASLTESLTMSLFHASISRLPMLVLLEPPCLSYMLSMLLKSPANIHSASGSGVCAKWFHNVALGPVSLKP